MTGSEDSPGHFWAHPQKKYKQKQTKTEIHVFVAAGGTLLGGGEKHFIKCWNCVCIILQ